MGNRLDTRRRVFALVTGLAILLTPVLSACANIPRKLPDFDRAQVASDAFPLELEDSVHSLKLDAESSRFLGEDSRGYGYFVVTSTANSSITEQCLAYFIGSESPGVVCSTSLPITVSFRGLGTATLDYLAHDPSQAGDGEWVGDHLHIEPGREP